MIIRVENKYIVHREISEYKFREILEYFCMDIENEKIAKLTEISEQSLCKIFKEIRILMANEWKKFLNYLAKPC